MHFRGPGREELRACTMAYVAHENGTQHVWVSINSALRNVPIYLCSNCQGIRSLGAAAFTDRPQCSLTKYDLTNLMQYQVPLMHL